VFYNLFCFSFPPINIASLLLEENISSYTGNARSRVFPFKYHSFPGANRDFKHSGSDLKLKPKEILSGLKMFRVVAKRIRIKDYKDHNYTINSNILKFLLYYQPETHAKLQS
jgi:hypothetical protein